MLGFKKVVHFFVGQTFSLKLVTACFSHSSFLKFVCESMCMIIYKLRQGPHYAGEIYKRSFISTVRPSVHSSLSRKRSFSKALFKPEKLENSFSFSCGRKKKLKTMTSQWSRDFPARVFLKHKSKVTCDCRVFKFLRRSADGKHLLRFWSETFVFKFLRRSVEGNHLMRFQSETSVFTFLRCSVDEALLFTVIESYECFFCRYQSPLLNACKRKEGSLGRELHRRKAKKKARNLRRLVLAQFKMKDLFWIVDLLPIRRRYTTCRIDMKNQWRAMKLILLRLLHEA